MQEIIKYQEIDMNLKKLESELRSSANRNKASEMQQYLKDSQNKLVSLDDNAKALAEQYDKAVKIYNDFATKLDNLIKEVDKASADKVDALNALVEKFSADAAKLENHISTLQGRMNAVAREVDNIMNNAKKAKHNLEVYRAQYAKEKEQLDPKINSLKQELAKQKEKVPADLLAKYNTKSDGKILDIFVPEINGRCKGCRMEISAGKMSKLSKEGVIECENCGRYIYK